MHRTNRRAHIFGALVAICAALAFSLTPLPAQALSTNSFYTGTRPGGGSRVNDAPLTAATGVTYALYYTDDSGQVSNYANVSDTDVNRMDKSVADVDLVHNLRAVLVVTNPGDGPISFHARLSTPYADYAGGGTEDRPLVRVSGAASFASTDDASEAYASLEADSGSTDPVPFADAAGAYAATNAWDDLKRVTLSGTIQPGETLTVTLPLELTNETRAVLYGHGFAKLGLWSSSTLEGRSNNASAFLRFARQLTEEDANGATVGRFQGGGKYLGVTVVPEGDLLAGTFTPVPADVQAAIPEISLEDFHFDNINYLDRHRATDDPTLYSGSVYSIDLRRIRNAIRDLGWSVGTGNSAVVYPGLPDWVLNEDENLDDDLMQEYRYRAAAKDAVILNPDGSDATLRGVNADGIRIGSIHVRLRPTIQTRDLELAVGDSWQPSDSLVSMSDHAGAAVGLDDAEHARVEHDVDTSLPGTCAVRFYHHYAGNAASGGDCETSRAATVAVTGTYRVAYDANGGTGEQTTVRVFCCVRVFTGLDDVFYRHQAREVKVLIDHENTFDTMLMHQALGIFKAGAFANRHETISRRHDLRNRDIHARFKAKVTGSYHTQDTLVIDNRQTGNVTFTAQANHFTDRHTWGNRNRIGHHTGFMTLHTSHFSSLLLRAHIFVNKTDTAFLGQSNGQT